MVDKTDFAKEMADKWRIKPSLVEKMVDIFIFMVDKQEVATEEIISEFGFAATTAKCCANLPSLAVWSAGGNRNRNYCINNINHTIPMCDA